MSETLHLCSLNEQCIYYQPKSGGSTLTDKCTQTSAWNLHGDVQRICLAPGNVVA